MLEMDQLNLLLTMNGCSQRCVYILCLYYGFTAQCQRSAGHLNKDKILFPNKAVGVVLLGAKVIKLVFFLPNK